MDNFATIARMARQARIMDQWKRIEDIESRYMEANVEYYELASRHSDMTMAILDFKNAVSDVDFKKLMSDVVAAKITMTSLFAELAAAQDRYNDLVIDYNVRSEPILDTDEIDCDVFECDDENGPEDVDYAPPARKTRNDIMTLLESVKAHKVQKTHKLKPRSVKRDRTKTPESKTKTRARREAIAA